MLKRLWSVALTPDCRPAHTHRCSGKVILLKVYVSLPCMGVKETWMSHRCVYSMCVCVGRECAPVVIAFLCLQLKDMASWSVYGLSNRGRSCWTDIMASSDWSVRNLHRAEFKTGSGRGEMDSSFCRVKWRNYDISLTLHRQKLNICSEASSNIFQVRGVGAVICYPCVPSGSGEERQRSCSYYNAVLVLTLHTLSMLGGTIHWINSSFIIFDNFCFSV